MGHVIDNYGRGEQVAGHVCDFRETHRITNAAAGRGGIRTTVYLACSCGATTTRNE